MAGNFTCEQNSGKNNDTLRELRPLHMPPVPPEYATATFSNGTLTFYHISLAVHENEMHMNKN